jgi:hypothetical protein
MRMWVKGTLVGVALIMAVGLTLAGVGAYYILGHLERRNAGEPETRQMMDAVRAKFGTRPPLVEVVDPRRADIRINRLRDKEGRPVATIHIVSWSAENGELVRTEAPLWLMRFSSVNLLSKLGIAPAKFRLSVEDIERYGPGIVIDYESAGSVRVLAWVD